MGNMKLFLRNPFGEFGNIIEGTVWLFDEDLQVRARQESWSFARSHHQVGGTRWWAQGGGHQVGGTRWWAPGGGWQTGGEAMRCWDGEMRGGIRSHLQGVINMMRCMYPGGGSGEEGEVAPWPAPASRPSGPVSGGQRSQGVQVSANQAILLIQNTQVGIEH